MIGEISGLGCALLWAFSSVVMKSQIARSDAFFLNAFRCIVGALFYCTLGFALGRMVSLLHATPLTIFYLISASISGFVIGDTLYYHSMGLIGVSKTLPIACSSPILTLFVSVFLFGRTMNWITTMGIVAVVIGVYLVATSHVQRRIGNGGIAGKKYALGVGLALIAAVFWALGTNLLSAGIADSDVIAVNALRMLVAAVSLTLFVLIRKRGFPVVYRSSWKPYVMLLVGALVGSAGGTLLFVISVKYAGASKAAVLSSAAPLFAVPMSLVMLKERVNLKLFVGTVVSVVGIYLVLTH